MSRFLNLYMWINWLIRKLSDAMLIGWIRILIRHQRFSNIIKRGMKEFDYYIMRNFSS